MGENAEKESWAGKGEEGAVGLDGEPKEKEVLRERAGAFVYGDSWVGVDDAEDEGEEEAIEYAELGEDDQKYPSSGSDATDEDGDGDDGNASIVS